MQAQHTAQDGQRATPVSPDIITRQISQSQLDDAAGGIVRAQGVLRLVVHVFQNMGQFDYENIDTFKKRMVQIEYSVELATNQLDQVEEFLNEI